MKIETNSSDRYTQDNITILCKFSKYCRNKAFKQLTRDVIIAFLETYHKTEVADSIYKWIGTYNIYRIYLLFFSNGYITPILNPAKDLNLQ
jgi:hypothetical protein